MLSNVDKLRQSLRTCGGYVNDHDYICQCRPVDVRATLAELDRLREENQRLRKLYSRASPANRQLLLEVARKVAR
jgi:hypothetical protein